MLILFTFIIIMIITNTIVLDAAMQLCLSAPSDNETKGNELFNCWGHATSLNKYKHNCVDIYCRATPLSAVAMCDVPASAHQITLTCNSQEPEPIFLEF
jgi:hypothetical protein